MFGKRIGFLKFKADVIDKETGTKVFIMKNLIAFEIKAIFVNNIQLRPGYKLY